MNKDKHNNLTPYSDKEISFLTKGKVTIATSNEDINKFINNTAKVKSSNNKIYLGIMNDKLSKDFFKKREFQLNRIEIVSWKFIRCSIIIFNQHINYSFIYKEFSI